MTETTLDANRLLAAAAEVLDTEAKAIAALADRLDDTLVESCRRIIDCPGHLIVLGIGKSGHIGHKIAATLASTGTPAFFVHPAEASHGDLGMIRREDLILAISNSGETEELVRLLPVIKRLGVTLIAMTGNPDSSLARHADLHLDTSVDQEACPLGLAPTASTSAQLAMGDALAIALLDARGFTAEDFARSHPGGKLGRKLLLHISDLMHQGDELPRVPADANLAQAIVEMTRSRLGLCALVDDEGRAVGVITDGDIRRHVEEIRDLASFPASRIMSRSPQTIDRNELAATAVELMQQKRIQGLLVTDEDGRLVGALNFQDLLQAGVV
ncbi:KpsF/GutQ family sugar-phosphate isomerase [Wenzhouxiangella marina]|uniref:Arabinose 5-phosphate isomerase n=1 Tax=Wenzhouxiangella marina TaxID=1579979 RepID=A0A0K0XTS2_9GAMM|nr:KpsF/GutQ family sugar-phosphate isomerase [Wenzhouxiangella marina]AKS41021.1 Arabinose 5-phosphate isomerase [Wenzhouxiangella marina]MBB6087899.1 arabinose-5-phosphate isomerase [Wenzhouxiangella marina]